MCTNPLSSSGTGLSAGKIYSKKSECLVSPFLVYTAIYTLARCFLHLGEERYFPEWARRYCLPVKAFWCKERELVRGDANYRAVLVDGFLNGPWISPREPGMNVNVPQGGGDGDKTYQW